MQAQATITSRLRYTLTNFSEIVALISFLILFVFFAIVADNFWTVTRREP